MNTEEPIPFGTPEELQELGEALAKVGRVLEFARWREILKLCDAVREGQTAAEAAVGQIREIVVEHFDALKDVAEDITNELQAEAAGEEDAAEEGSAPPRIL